MKRGQMAQRTKRYQTVVNGKKRCARCNKWKVLTAFSDQKRKQATGLTSSCNDCRHALVFVKVRKKKEEVIKAYGGKCACCGEDELVFLQIDHVNHDGKEHRAELRKNGGGQRSRIYQWLKKHKWPKKRFRLLCVNCNFATRLGQPCPYEPIYKDWLEDRFSKAKL